MEEFSKGAIMLLLEVIVSIGIVVFLFWYFYLKTPNANLPDKNKNTLENYQEVIDSAKSAKCLSEAKDQQDKDNCLKEYPKK